MKRYWPKGEIAGFVQWPDLERRSAAAGELVCLADCLDQVIELGWPVAGEMRKRKEQEELFVGWKPGVWLRSSGCKVTEAIISLCHCQDIRLYKLMQLHWEIASGTHTDQSCFLRLIPRKLPIGDSECMRSGPPCSS